ncbi:hypothetical protein D4764_14G0012180 [Takifugu flavidus]|uniref:Uncharacterized protein n=1 Tax=Takifugu flavidus TaxID=433684 RepID=A0A5C6P712_9TELE|nr:hypothetical protein D4764_14G0012180 [Takifugu flavidus]
MKFGGSPPLGEARCLSSVPLEAASRPLCSVSPSVICDLPLALGSDLLRPATVEKNMLKSSGLKIPGRGPKHSSPMGRTSAGGTSSPVVPKDSKDPRS